VSPLDPPAPPTPFLGLGVGVQGEGAGAFGPWSPPPGGPTTPPIHRPSPPAPARLVFLLQDLAFGGTQRHTLELARRLDRGGFAPEIWLLARGADLAPLAREGGVPLVWLGDSRIVGPGSLVALARRLWDHPPDLLIPLTVVPNIWGRLWGRLARVPVIVGNCRGGNAPGRQHERWLWRLAHRVITNSAALRDRLVKDYHVPPARLTVIPNGVDVDYFRPRADGSATRPVILSLARLVPDKDPATLVAAFGQLAPEVPEAELWLVGEGPLQRPLQTQTAAQSWGSRVRFLPGRPDPRPFFRAAAVLALSSVAEALPNVVLEAMACGLPVVATAVGGVPELVADGVTGLLVPPRDPVALAGALRRVLAHRDAAAVWGAAGRRRVEAEFTPEVMVRRHTEVFSELLAGAGVR